MSGRKPIINPSEDIKKASHLEVKSEQTPRNNTMVGNLKLNDTLTCGSATGNPRNKVALKPGHSLMDWIRLGTSGQDLTGVGGVLQDVTPAQLASHNKLNDAWLAIRGKVYNVTHYLDFHPGGPDELMRGIGKDATELFNQIHAWVNYDSILQKCVVGRLRHKEISKQDLTALLFDSTRPNISASALEEASVKKTNVSMDWFQQRDSLTLVYYTKVPIPQAQVQLRGLRDLVVQLRLGERVFLSHLTLDADVTWPCKVKVTLNTGKVEVRLFKMKPGMWQTFGIPASGNGTLSQVCDETARFLTLCVVDTLPVTHNTTLLVLRYTDQVYNTFPLGHHIRLRFIIDGMEVIRSYTPVVPALHPLHTPKAWTPDCVCLMVKLYPGGLSARLCGLKQGDSLLASGPHGTFQPQAIQRTKHLFLLAAGTGFTPMTSLILWVLEGHSKNCQNITLIFFNRTEDDILWKDQIDKLTEENDRFQAIHILSMAGDRWHGHKGHVDRPLLQLLLPEANGDQSHFVCICGPLPFTQLTQKLLEELGYSDNQFHSFLG